MNPSSKWLAFGAFACVAGCLAAAALPALVGGGLAALGASAFGWEIGAVLLVLILAAVAWLYVRRRRRERACGCARTETAP